ncbi:MAG: NAD(P)H-dependent oxidoreductase subunit E [Chloroflexi bacterium]|nr:NAD(P)H-dependent oxidoreductase subunit E [Chloroflexota bacterium]
MAVAEEHDIQAILQKYPQEQTWLLPIFHETQHAYGSISTQHVLDIAGYLGMTPAQVHEVLTFYAEFRQEPAPDAIVRFCQGPACYLRGLYRLQQMAEATLGVRLGQTSPDNRYSLEPIQCNGTCELAPLMFVNDVAIGNVTLDDVRAIGEAVKAGTWAERTSDE